MPRKNDENGNRPREFRNFALVLYPEDAQTDIEPLFMGDDEYAFEYIVNNFDYAYILHDKDVDESGVLKKAHYHVLVKLQSAMPLETFANRIRLSSNRVEWVRNFTGAVRYLIHFDDSDKYQYSIENIVTNMAIDKYFRSNLDVEKQGKLLMDYILNTNPTYIELCLFALSNGCYSEFRRGSFLYRQIVIDNLRNNLGGF